MSKYLSVSFKGSEEEVQAFLMVMEERQEVNQGVVKAEDHPPNQYMRDAKAETQM